MNESDYLRQQLSTQRAHLREVLELLRRAPRGKALEHTAYLTWAGRRLQEVHDRHRVLLPGRVPAQTALPEPPQLPMQATAHALRAPAAAPLPQAALTSLLAACEQLEQLAGGCYRIMDWRHVAQLDADAILEEQRLYEAART